MKAGSPGGGPGLGSSSQVYGLMMLAAAERQHVEPNFRGRISFIDALDVLRHHDSLVAATPQ